MPHRLACLDDPHFDMAPVKDWGSMSEDKEQQCDEFVSALGRGCPWHARCAGVTSRHRTHPGVKEFGAPAEGVALAYTQPDTCLAAEFLDSLCDSG